MQIFSDVENWGNWAAVVPSWCRWRLQRAVSPVHSIRWWMDVFTFLVLRIKSRQWAQCFDGRTDSAALALYWGGSWPQLFKCPPWWLAAFLIVSFLHFVNESRTLQVKIESFPVDFESYYSFYHLKSTLNYHRNLIWVIQIDSPLIALQLCFWLLQDRSTKLDANSRKLTSLDGASFESRPSRVTLRSNGSTDSIGHKRLSIENSKSYPTVSKHFF